MSQYKSLWLAATTLAVSIAVPFAQPGYSQSSVTFICGVGSDGIPTTFAQTPRGNVSVIKWLSEYFSNDGYSPERRCREVTSQFNNLYRQGRLNYLSAGRKNGLPIICALGSPGGECTQLYTLKPGQDASRVLANLRAVQVGARGPLYESTRRNSGNPDLVDLNAYLQNAPVESASTNTEPATTPTAPTAQPNPASGGGGIW